MSDSSGILRLQREVATLQRRHQAAISELQDMLFTISHDFRGPIRSIMSSSMILLEDFGPTLDQEAKSELTRQSDSARKLNQMLEELLKLSRLSRRQLQQTETDLGTLFLEVASRFGITGSQIDVSGDLELQCDPELLTIVFQNLVENAIKFQNPGVDVHLTLIGDDRGLHLTDNGIGFLQEQGERIFQPFERLNGDRYPGAGTGLTQVKRIIAMHDGEITAEGHPGTGATLHFTLTPS